MFAISYFQTSYIVYKIDQNIPRGNIKNTESVMLKIKDQLILYFLLFYYYFIESILSEFKCTFLFLLVYDR